MQRRVSLTSKLVLMVVVLILLSTAGYWMLQREVAEIQSTIARAVDASHTMLRSAYEMEILVMEIAARTRRMAVNLVVPPDFDTARQHAAFESLLNRFASNAQDGHTRGLASDVEKLFSQYLEEVTDVASALTAVADRLPEVAALSDEVELAVTMLTEHETSFGTGTSFATAIESADDLLRAARQFAFAGRLQDAWQMNEAANRLERSLRALPPEATDDGVRAAVEGVSVTVAAIRGSGTVAADLRRQLDDAVSTAYRTRDELQQMIQERLQSSADAAVDVARREVDRRIVDARHRLTAVLLMAAALGFGGSVTFARSIVAPVRRMVEALRAAGRGDLRGRLTVVGNDEFSDMAVAFNQTVSELQRLTVTRAFLDDILHSISDGVFVIDSDYRIRSCNPAAAALLEMSAQEVEGAPLDRFLRVTGGHRLQPEAMREGDIECEIVRADGHVRPVLFSLSPLSDDGRREERFVCTITDITQIKQAEQDLLSSREELRAAYVALQRVQEQERRQLAKEVHDEFGAVLTVMNSTLFLLRNAAPELGAPALALIEQLQELIRQASQATERIADGLHPPILDHFGLPAALEWYAEKFEQWTGIVTRISALPEVHLGEEHNVAIFRVAQECLTNVARHAHARSVRIDLEESGGWLTLTIEDDGTGCGAEELTAPDRHGLRGLRERLGSLGGTLDAEALAGHGLRVRARLPLPVDAPAPAAPLAAGLTGGNAG